MTIDHTKKNHGKTMQSIRLYTWVSFQRRGRPVGPMTLLQTIQFAEVAPNTYDLDAIADLEVGESLCISEIAGTEDDASKPILGEFTRVQ